MGTRRPPSDLGSGNVSRADVTSEKRKVGGSTPPLPTASDLLKTPERIASGVFDDGLVKRSAPSTLSGAVERAWALMAIMAVMPLWSAIRGTSAADMAGSMYE
jgi:hypothetical protein